MKRLSLFTAAAALCVSQAMAGGLADAVEETPIVVPQVTEEPGSGSGNLIVPLIAIVLIAVALSGSDDDEPGFSDARLKHDIEPVGTTSGGLPLYRYSYKGLPGTYEGVMAQDVAQLRPDALVQMPLGYLGVDYGALGLRLTRID